MLRFVPSQIIRRNKSTTKMTSQIQNPVAQEVTKTNEFWNE